MASITLSIKSWELRKDGTAPVVFVFTTKSNVYYPTCIHCKPNDFDKKSHHLVGRKWSAVDLQLHSKLLSYQETAKELSKRVNLNALKSTEFRDMVIAASTISRQSSFFIERMRNFASLKKAKRTRELYEATINRIDEFSPIAETLVFDDITKEWITKFDMWLQDRGNRPNTRSIHLRNIRAVIMDAIDNDLATKNPFRRFSMPREETRHRCLTAEQIVALRDVRLTGNKEIARDVFFLCLYLIGINVTDLFSLTNIVNGRIEYRRSKTKKMYSIKVEPEAMAIIEKYQGRDKLLRIADSMSSAHALDMWLNDYLQRIRLTEFLDVDLTLYWARHTWATIAHEIGVAKETISRALGHSSSSVTDIYINYNNRSVDEANRKVIDFINNL